MPLEAPLPPLGARVAALNVRHAHHGAITVLSHALSDPEIGALTLVSSFGAESVALLHMLSVIDRSVPVLFLDTEMLFPETLAYQTEVATTLGLRDVRILRPDRAQTFRRDPDALLHQSAPDACCTLRKTEPLARALAGFDGWVTGRKRYQGGARAQLAFFETDGDRIKVNPLAQWSRDDLRDYIVNNRLPRHPMVARGYPSIGCAPCTTRTGFGEDDRAGRWRGRAKVECGIHFEDGRALRA